MKNKIFITILCGIITLTWIISLLEPLNFSEIALFFNYFSNSNIGLLIYIIILNIVVFYMIISLYSALKGWMGKKGIYGKFNLRKNLNITIISIITTLLFNIMGLANYFFLKTPIINSMIENLWLGFLLLLMSYLLFTVLILVQKPLKIESN